MLPSAKPTKMNPLNRHALVLFVSLVLSFFTFAFSTLLFPGKLPTSSKILRQSEENQDTPVSQGGLVLDKCREDSDCADSELLFISCHSVNRGIVGRICSENTPTCRCVPDFDFTVFQSCDDDNDCIDGEVCVVYTPGNTGLLTHIQGDEEYDFTVPFCASEEAERELSDIERHPVSSSSGSTPTGTESVIDTTTPFPSGKGLAMDTCREYECLVGDQFASCESVNRGSVGFSCVVSMPTCRCLPLALKRCRNEYDCILGEVCVTYTPGFEGLLSRHIDKDYDKLDQPFCASEEAEKNLVDLELYPAPSDEDSESAPTGNETLVDTMTSFSSKGGGLFLDPCQDAGDCVFTGEISYCGTFQSDDVGNDCDGQGTSCRCMHIELLTAFEACKDDGDCVVEEGCARYTGERGEMLTEVPFLDFTRPFCVSLAAIDGLEDVELLSPTSSAPTTPTKRPTQDTGIATDGMHGTDHNEICIDARAISHLRPDELVFDNHVRARVLCDSKDSCATPDHIVTFQGRVMRMRRYCEVSGGQCREAEMLVNSPRYRRGMRIESKTEGLLFTAFAARYGTHVEDMVLTLVVRLGM